ncbi:hypothetical protein AABM17_1778 [Neisseria musculi]|uniref:Uncharacterized protein n=1 Tax=Neisseria musculi TaxID=1815583 RepID=A0A7H1M989_9NEIS|nr:hypothetical protein H7A79_1777 [Neisseria musculi]QNT58204.1 hypothetical protein H7A79_1512 [Neisseria musculi]QNT60393.1 hypothetical protein H7A79_1248 [Neisseria musculi]
MNQWGSYGYLLEYAESGHSFSIYDVAEDIEKTRAG